MFVVSWGVCPGLGDGARPCGLLGTLFDSYTECACSNPEHSHASDWLCAACDEDHRAYWHEMWDNYYSMTSGYGRGRFVYEQPPEVFR